MDEYLGFAKELAKQAGEIMIAHFQVGVASETKTDNTPVTIADKAINKLVISAVKEKFSDHDIVGEEESSASNNAEFVWICDPIDGTIPYTFGTPTSMFSLALTKNGRPIVAVLYDPYLDRLYEAIEGRRTLLNGNEVQVNDNHLLKGSYVALAGMKFGDLIGTEALLSSAVHDGIRTFSLCCVTYECALVATGQITAAVFQGKTPWDIAAVKLIVEGAGGRVTDIQGNEQRYDQPINGAIISNGLVHNVLVDLVASYII